MPGALTALVLPTLDQGHPLFPKEQTKYPWTEVPFQNDSEKRPVDSFNERVDPLSQNNCPNNWLSPVRIRQNTTKLKCDS